MSASISISTSDSYVFTNTRSNDLLLYHNQSNAGVVFGVSNSSNTIRISSNATTFTGAVSFPPASISTAALSGLVQVSSNQAFSNVYTSNIYAQNAALSNLTIPTTLDVTGATIIGLRTINSNQAFSNVYTSNIYTQDAAVSNLSVSSASTFTGAATFNGAVTFPAGSISTSALSGLVQVNSNQAFSNVYTSNVYAQNAALSNLTIPTTLDVTGATIIGLRTINSNQAFSNVYTSNIYTQDAAVSNLSVSSASTFTGATTFNGGLGVSGQLTNSTAANTYVPVDMGVSNFPISGSIVGSVPASSSGPFAIPEGQMQEGSLSLNGNAANYLVVAPAGSSAAPTAELGSFTLETWIYLNAYPVSVEPGYFFPYLIGQMTTNGAVTWTFGVGGTSLNRIAITGGGNVQGSTTIPLQTWTHIAMAYTASSRTLQMFVNGSPETITTYRGSAITGEGTTSVVLPATMGGDGVPRPLMIGQCGGVAMNCYVSNLRYVQGSVLYSASFTPSVGPLGPASSGTTALLLRVPQQPGTILLKNVGGSSQCSQTQAYPPAALTANSCFLNGAYGAGTYVVSSSIGNATEFFNGSGYQTPDSSYNGNAIDTASGYYSGTQTTTDAFGNSYKGEWVQIMLPVPIVLSKYYLQDTLDNNWSPQIFYLLGSKDGITWTCVDNHNGAGGGYIAVSTTAAYSYFRWICYKTFAYFRCHTGYFKLYGTQASLTISDDGRLGVGVTNPVQALEVAGNAVIYGSISAPGQTITASNITTEFLSTSNVIYSQISLFSGAAAVNVNSGAMNQGFSNVTVSGSLSNTGTTTLSNLVITGTVEGFNGVSSNQSFSNVYSSNIYGSNVFGSNAAFSNLTIHSSESNNGSLSVSGVLRSATLSNTGTLSNAGAALFSSNVGIGLATPQYPLDVVGNANFSGNISAGNLGMFRNRIINGDMRINQRGATTLSGDGYFMDRWLTTTSAPITTSRQTLTSADLPYQKGLQTSIRVTANSAITSEYIIPQQPIEGTNLSDMMWGTAYGASVTVSFWVKTNGVPTLPVRLKIAQNGEGSYITTVTVNQNLTWQYVSFTIPPPPVGTILSTTNVDAFDLSIGLYNSGYQVSTYNVWSNSNNGNNYPAINCYSSAGNYVEFTGVQLEKGTIATPFEFRPFAVELQLCQRYFHSSYEIGTAPGSINALTGRLGTYATTASAMLTAFFPVTMRTVPSIIGYNAFSGAAGYANIGGGPSPVAVSIQASSKSVNLFVDNVGSTNNYYYFHYAANAEL